MSGTFVKTTLCARSLWGGGRGKFFSRVHTKDISRSPWKSHRVFLSSDTKNCWSRQEDAEFNFSPPTARIALLLSNMWSLLHVFCRWSVAWHDDPAISRTVAGVCRSCSVKTVLWANNPLYFQEEKRSANRLDKNQRHRARCSFLLSE